jgi:hypothetical protein
MIGYSNGGYLRTNPERKAVAERAAPEPRALPFASFGPRANEKQNGAKERRTPPTPNNRDEAFMLLKTQGRLLITNPKRTANEA